MGTFYNTTNTYGYGLPVSVQITNRGLPLFGLLWQKPADRTSSTVLDSSAQNRHLLQGNRFDVRHCSAMLFGR